MIFHKTVCSGNDFIHIELDQSGLANDENKGDLARRISNRNSGAGADGVVYYRVLEKQVDFEIFNQDGSRAELSGNGMAGLSALMFHLDLFRNRIRLNTPVGGRTVELIEQSADSFRLRIEIGVPDFQNTGFFPFLEKDRIKYRFKNIDFFPVSVGNPHAVVFLTSSESERDLSAKGKDLGEASLLSRSRGMPARFSSTKGGWGKPSSPQPEVPRFLPWPGG
jgi:diaminopimelate epimerase